MDAQFNSSSFDDIRPYTDEECLGVIERLLEQNEIFFRVGRMAFPRISKISPSWAALLCRMIISNKLRTVHNIKSFQLKVVAWFFFRMLNKTSDGITNIWQDKPDENKSYLFLSNHRDIAVDPAVVCHNLFLRDLPFPLVGIGDNLLSNRYAADVMRLNRSFIVKRSFSSVREMLKEIKHLSCFIRFSIEQGENVWLAQREGRAKDSRDKTSPAVLKMLRLSKGKEISVAAALNSLNIRSVSISYQYDPCAIYKAKELTWGKRKKATGGDATDLQELGAGMTGYKGKIHVYISQQMIWDDDASITDIANSLDKEIVSNYKLFNSHFYALEQLVKRGLESTATLESALKAFKPDTTECPYLEKRIKAELTDSNPQLLESYLRVYANPVIEKLALINES